jgi:hypothetical protein
MIHSTRHSSQRVIKLFISLLTILLIGCEKERDNIDYVAKVNDAYLTREEFASLVDTSTASQVRKNEAIARWIQGELLYQMAEREGLLNQEQYKTTLQKSERELAGALMIDKMIKAENIETDPKEIRTYYEKNINEFRIPTDAYALNLAEFIDEDNAIRFRNVAVNTGWSKAVTQFISDEYVVNHKSNQLFLSYEINPAPLYRLVRELYPQEISIVISSKPGYYTVVQLLERLTEGSVPSYEYAEQNAKERVIAIKRQALLNNFIKELYSKSKIEIKNQD